MKYFFSFYNPIIIYSNIRSWQLIVYEYGQLNEPMLCVLTNYKPTNCFCYRGHL